jgi:thymidylate synthase
MHNVSDIRNEFIKLYNNKEFVIDKSGVKTLEYIGSSFNADESAIFGKPNKDYIKREIDWYTSQSLDVDDIEGKTPKIWQDISSRSGLIHSNYGYLIYSDENENQYASCLNALLDDKNTRRAIMIYTRPQIQREYDNNGMSDFICTNSVQYVIRNNKLHAIVNMRSNDVIFGYRNDWAWQKHVLSKLVKEYNATARLRHINYVGVSAGDITWQIGSLHVYERHFKYIEDEISKRVRMSHNNSLADKIL